MSLDTGILAGMTALTKISCRLKVTRNKYPQSLPDSGRTTDLRIFIMLGTKHVETIKWGLFIASCLKAGIQT